MARLFNIRAEQLLTRTVLGQAGAIAIPVQNDLSVNTPAWQRVNVANYKIWYILNQAVINRIIKACANSPVRIAILS